MRLRDINPELSNLDLEEFFKAIQWGTVFSLLPQIAEYYNSKISMVYVLNYYGLDYVTSGIDHMQVHCLLLDHGTSDFNKSARFYTYDRNTGEPKEGVWCFKCQKYLTPFWYLYKMEKDFRSRGLLDFFILLRKIFRVDFPKDLILDFDPDSFYTFEGGEDRQNILSLFSYARSLRGMKQSDIKNYLSNLVNFYQTMKIGA